MEVTGKLTAGETYYLHEKKTPSGYLPAADISFTVPRKNQQIEVTMIDLKRHDSETNTMYLMKTGAETGKGLEGFEFTVTGPEVTPLPLLPTRRGRLNSLCRRMGSIHSGRQKTGRISYIRGNLYLYNLEWKSYRG